MTAIVIGPDKVAGARLLTLRSALHLEQLGMRHSRGSILKLVKKEFNLTGNRASVTRQFSDLVTAATGIAPHK